MVNVGICGDHSGILDILEEMISNYGVSNNVDFAIHKYNSGNCLVSENTKFDIIFMNIKMKGMDGIKTASEIRKKDMKVPIIFVTSYADYWNMAYKVHAFDFIVKPFTEEDIHKVLNDFFAFMRSFDSTKISLSIKDGTIFENAGDICYFMIKERKTIQVSTIYREYLIKESLSGVYKKLNSDQFYMTHKSCIVNLKYVMVVRKNDGIIMNDGTWLPLAQKKQKDFIDKLSKHIFK